MLKDSLWDMPQEYIGGFWEPRLGIMRLNCIVPVPTPSMSRVAIPSVNG